MAFVFLRSQGVVLKGMKMAFSTTLFSSPLPFPSPLCLSVSLSLSLSHPHFCGLIADSGTIVVSGTQAGTWQSKGLTCQLPPLPPAPLHPSTLTPGARLMRGVTQRKQFGYSNEELSCCRLPPGAGT